MITDTLIQIPRVPGLGDDHERLVRYLLDVIQRKAGRNRLRRRYYDYKVALKDLGEISSIPPSLKSSAETVVGWPAKAVDSMARRTVFEGFDLPNGDLTALGVDDVLEANGAAALIPQTLTSSLIHAVSFMSVTAGDVQAGEPEALILARSAEWASGIWDNRRRALTAALSIVGVSDNGDVTEMILHLPNLSVIMRRESDAKWDIRQSAHELGVPVEAVPYKPTLDRPFGHSRISRPVMSLTDSAVRTLLRTEVGAEFFNAPQRYALGVEPEAFGGKTGWELMMGRMLTLTRDEDGNMPDVGQFSQQSMEPNIAHYRMQAQAFSAETSLPLRSLGVVGDNPESADAIAEANAELELEIRHWQNSSLSPALKRTVTNALRIIDDSPAARAEYARMRPRWANPTTVSTAARADSFVKVASAVEGLAQTEVGQRMAGLSDDEIELLQAQLRRLNGSSILERVLASREAAPVDVPQ